MSNIKLPQNAVVPHRAKVAAVQQIARLKASGHFNPDGTLSGFVTVNAAQQDEVTKARQAAQQEWLRFNVLILGETGTGKELMARTAGTRNTVNEAGAIVPAKFSAVNAGAVTDTLFESILFGHVKGSFTGAIRDHTGVLEEVGDGTVFIDEIGDLPLNQQVKMLRAIDARTITPVGSAVEKPIKCRFVFATNKNLPRMVKLGLFRADLYFRIAEIVVRTFPLRERSEDAYPIASRIIAQNNWTPLEVGETIPPRAYSKGNVRDLKRCLLWREQGLDWDGILIELQREDDMENMP